MMKIYTKTGDDGTTSLAGGTRMPKSSVRIEAYGTVDEVIAHIGVVAYMPENRDRINFLVSVQSRLMHCAALLAAGPGANTSRMVAPSNADIAELEGQIDSMEALLKPLNSFVLPGGSVNIASIHVARVVARRAERAVIRLSEEADVDWQIVKYLNRLSDYLFVLARKVASECGVEQPAWIP
jgi:cob(I)alamin adenosyltransferase